jgi:hypothetical protein
VVELARAAYPLVIEHLTSTGALPERSDVDFVHPAARNRAARGKGEQRR